MTEELLRRIADALDRLAPPPPAAADPLAHAAYVWRDGLLTRVAAFAPLPLADLIGIDRQRDAVMATLRRLAAGHAAHDVLLWGARGTGKSALVKAAVGAVRAEGADLALVAVAGGALATLPALFDTVRAAPRAFAIFIDDLGVDAPHEARALRSMLEGEVEARPANARLLVTANRRNIVARVHEGEAVNPRDAADDVLALADRFGLSLGFHVVDQAGYLAIVRGYADRLGLAFQEVDALAWAAGRGSRSGRVARQFVDELAGRAGRGG